MGYGPSSPPQILLVHKIIHKHPLQQRIRFILQPIVSLRLVELQPRCLALHPSAHASQLQTSMHHPEERKKKRWEHRTLNLTTNPVSHSFSLSTPVSSSGVSNGRPPLGFSASKCAYWSYRARTTPPRHPPSASSLCFPSSSALHVPHPSPSLSRRPRVVAEPQRNTQDKKDGWMDGWMDRKMQTHKPPSSPQSPRHPPTP
ncbi:hypothetical protein PMIN07_007948 [Paraphaeosphaeria minitans]